MSNNLTGRETVAVSVKGFAENADTADIAVLSGGLLLASGNLAGAFIDLALPAEYNRFHIELQDVFFSAADNLSAVLSFDGGLTWLNDTVNANSYINGSTILLEAPSGLFSPSFSDTEIDFGFFQIATGHFGTTALLDLFPGSATLLPYLFFNTTGVEAGQPNLPRQTIGVFFVNPVATVVPTPARATTIRVLPYGNGDANPPTSGHVFTAGTYRFWGIV